MRLVELTEELWDKNDVGGDIDAVQVRWWEGSERLHWYKRKPNCRD
jgi:hypothetical protein